MINLLSPATFVDVVGNVSVSFVSGDGSFCYDASVIVYDTSFNLLETSGSLFPTGGNGPIEFTTTVLGEIPGFILELNCNPANRQSFSGNAFVDNSGNGEVPPPIDGENPVQEPQGPVTGTVQLVLPEGGLQLSSGLTPAELAGIKAALIVLFATTVGVVAVIKALRIR